MVTPDHVDHGAGTPTALGRAVETIRRLREQLGERNDRQPIAVIGVGLRLPGAIEDLSGYWDALVAGRDLVRPMPEGRKAPFADEWNALPRRGGFLEDVLGFDAAFFGISPREARAMDPQHRLLLEVSWEALEDAAIPPDRLGPENGGLYVGLTGQDYRDWLTGDPDPYWTTGNGHCFAAGRLAYTLGLTGPAVAMDTACSSSLVAVHLAVQALRRGECRLALAGGVNLILSPRSTRLVAQTRSLAPDGLCKTFDARANGFTRGEGCGVIVLKRLDHALRDGDRVHAVIHGSAVNQDGRSTGFTAPNVLAQVALIEAALADAGLTPADIGMVEAHGTGTPLGDPIEMDALVAALAGRSGGRELLVGAVKTNIGHAEAAAGIAGLIKVILCLQRRVVPPLVHFRTLNPRINLDGTRITLPTSPTSWHPEAAGRYAGVSSFGMSGTNAHVILGPPQHETGASGSSGPTPPGFELTARTPEDLRALAARLGPHLAGLSDDSYPAFAHTVTFGRARHGTGVRVTAPHRTAAVAALRAVASGEQSPAVAVVDSASHPAALADLPRRVLDLPHYPWQREPFAPEPAVAAAAPSARGDVVTSAVSPRYVGWQRIEVAEDLTGRHPVVLAGDDEELRELLVSEAATRGQAGTVLGGAGECPPGWRREPLPDCDAAWNNLWSNCATPPKVLVLAMKAPRLPAPDRVAASLGQDIAGAGAALCESIVGAVRALPVGRCWVLTRASWRATEQDQILPTVHTLLAGLGAVLGLEYPAVWGGLVDMPATPRPVDVRALLALVDTADTGQPREDLVAIRAGEVLAARLRDVPSFTPELPVRADASYLVTGGLGAVGRTVAGDLIRRGARHLLVIGRRRLSELDAVTSALMDRWRAEGVAVAYACADCGDADALSRACAVLDGMPEVRGVIHAAGVAPRESIAQAGTDLFVRALAGKFAGAWLLHLLSSRWPLEWFVATSSVSALWGTEGYAAYAAANSGLDALMAFRDGLGSPSVSLAFGPWAVDGMVDGDSRGNLARMGVRALDPTSGCAGLTATAPAGSPLVVCSVDWPRFLDVMDSRRPRALFADLRPPGSAEPDRTTELDALPEKARRMVVHQRMLTYVSKLLGYQEPETVREDVGLYDLGLDSIMAVDLARGLTGQFGTEVTISDVFDHPTVDGLAGLIAGRLAADPPPSSVEEGAAARQRAATSSEIMPVRASEPTVPADEPIAIIGMAGRFPGANCVDELWDLLARGGDAVGMVPADRWDIASVHDAGAPGPGRITTDQGGFLTDIDRFDASFFGIPGREAESLDPQQRLLLECSWNALEEANIDPSGLKDSATGVFVGITNSDYARLLERGGLRQLDAYFGTGTALNAAAGRVSYVLGLHGPALAVDTACSSALVALHLAMRSLRLRETDQALVGGVNVIASPTCSVAISQAHMLSRDGRCKTFSAAADGFVRSEGCGVMVLKRLSDAHRDGDFVHAVLYGSAVNQDGASSGLTVPSGRAQEAVIAAALADAGVTGDLVSYLEAHGTGTSLGDPIELAAAWSVFGPDRRAGEPLQVGSVKSNIGHAESAAGMASLIKVVLALRHSQLPASLHCDTLNPHVPWQDMNLRVVESLIPWRSPGNRARLAGVSAFGFSGTNAHVVIGDAPSGLPRRQPPNAAMGGPVLLPLSAPDQAGLRRVRESWRQHLTTATDPQIAQLAAAAGAGRAHFPARQALLGTTVEQIREALSVPGPPEVPSRAPRIGFMFSGQGSQYFGMGRELYATEPVFREVIDACDAVLAGHLGIALADLMFSGPDQNLVNQTRFTQPALVALELALAELWRSWGVEASVVLGHSVGEIAAAVYAGVMERDAGLTLIAHRARLMNAGEPGAMLAVPASLERVTGWLAGTGLDVAAINGDEAVVVSGPRDDIRAFAEQVRERGVIARLLAVSHAFHSRMMEPMLGAFAAALSPLRFGAPALPIIANVTGHPAAQETYNVDYWCRHVRQPVRFHDGVAAARRLNVDLLLEVGPDRTLVNLIRDGGSAHGAGALPSLRRGRPCRTTMLAAAKALYELGQDLDWRRLQPGPRGRAPRYPFADTRYWTAAVRPTTAHETSPRPGQQWGTELRSPALTGQAFAFEHSTEFPPYLADHRLYDTVVAPAASHFGSILSAVGRQGRAVTIEDLICQRALIVKDGERYQTQVLVDADGTTLGVQALLDPARDRWQMLLSGRLSPQSAHPRPVPDRAEFIGSAGRHIAGEAFYGYIRTLGYTLGPSFEWIAEVWVRGTEALIRYRQPALPNDPTDYEMHPTLIDACLQGPAAFMVDDDADEAPSLAIPFAATKLSFPGRPVPGEELWGHITALRPEPLPNGRLRAEVADIHLFTATGRSLFVAEEFRTRHAPRAVLTRSLQGETANAYELTWVTPPPCPAAPATRCGTVLILGEGDLAGALDAEVTSLGHRVVRDGTGECVDLAADLIVDVRFAAPVAATAEHALAATSRLSRSLVAAPHRVPYTVLADAGTQAAPVRESLWALAAAVEAEEPDRRLIRVALAEHWSLASLAQTLLRALTADPPEARLLITGTEIRVARLAQVSLEPPIRTWRGSVLITGGLGALGLSLARILAGEGVRAITLMCRSEPDPVARGVLDGLAARGVRVETVAGDVAYPTDCAKAVAVASQLAPLTGVFHLAGVTADGAFTNLSDDDFETVFTPKARGAENLATATGHLDLDALVFFSSVSAVLGSSGQANYAAANGFLDGLALSLRALGVPAVSVNWGPWAPAGKPGMAGTPAAARAAQQMGIRPLGDAEAAALLAPAVTSSRAGLVAVAVDIERYREALHGHPRAVLVSGLPNGSPVAGPADRPADRAQGWLRSELFDLAGSVRHERLRAAIRELVGEVLGESQPEDDTVRFTDIGLDSIMVIDLRTRLVWALNIELPGTVAFDHPSVLSMSGFVADLVFSGTPEPELLDDGTDEVDLGFGPVRMSPEQWSDGW